MIYNYKNNHNTHYQITICLISCSIYFLEFVHLLENPEQRRVFLLVWFINGVSAKYNMNYIQEVLERTNRPLSFDTTLTS
jgi:hypothetical protein